MPSNIDRHRVYNRQKQREARENGNFGILFFLIVMGFCLFAGSSILTQMRTLGSSLREKLSEFLSKNKAELSEKDPLRKAGKIIQQNDKVIEEAGKNMGISKDDKDDER